MNKINNKYQITPTNQKAGLRGGSQQPNTWRRECEGEGLLSFPCGKLCHLIVMLPMTYPTTRFCNQCCRPGKKIYTEESRRLMISRYGKQSG